MTTEASATAPTDSEALRQVLNWLKAPSQEGRKLTDVFKLNFTSHLHDRFSSRCLREHCDGHHWHPRRAGGQLDE